MKKKILYLFSDTGGGHRSAATSLMKAVDEIKKKEAPLQEMVDVFAECSAFLNIFAKLYAPVIKYSPAMWGMLYYWFNDMKKVQQMEKIARPFIEKELASLIARRKPDLIVSVHPLLNHITIAAMKTAKRVVPLMTVITDPVSLHRSWVCKDAAKIIVATQDAKKACIEYGASPSQLKLIGLPIDPKFTRPVATKDAIRKEMGIRKDLFTVLLMGGGEGGGNMMRIVKELDRARPDIQMIIIAGRNKSLQNKLERLSPKLSFPIKVYGFTNEVPEIMTASDLVITKAGPGSIAEALAKELPMVITSWLPGQEEGNVDHVVKNGLGVVNKDYRQMPLVIKQFMGTKLYKSVKANMKKANNPHAVFDIAKEILGALK